MRDCLFPLCLIWEHNVSGAKVLPGRSAFGTGAGGQDKSTFPMCLIWARGANMLKWCLVVWHSNGCGGAGSEFPLYSPVRLHFGRAPHAPGAFDFGALSGAKIRGAGHDMYIGCEGGGASEFPPVSHVRLVWARSAGPKC